MALHLTGSINISGSISGSMSGSFQGDGSRLTGISDAFPYTGSAIISGSAIILGNQQVTGSVSFSYISYSSGIWSSGGNMIEKRKQGGGFGTQNAAVIAGGWYFTDCLNTEHYDGSSWSAGGALINPHTRPGAVGTETSGLIFGGEPHPSYSNCTEEYDGTSWSSGGTLIQPTYEKAGAGTQNAALAHGGRNYFGGAVGSTTTYYACTEEYDGTSWSSGGALAIARHGLGGAGTQNAGIAFGGECTGEVRVSCTEEYDGTSWSAGGALITERKGVGSGGTQDQALAFGGFGGTPNSILTCTEIYNGTSWSVDTAMTAATCFMGSTNNSTANLSIGGANSSGQVTCVTQEYTLPNLSPTTFDYSSTTGETMILPPTTDPGVAGALWNNAGTLAISAG